MSSRKRRETMNPSELSAALRRSQDLEFDLGSQDDIHIDDNTNMVNDNESPSSSDKSKNVRFDDNEDQRYIQNAEESGQSHLTDRTAELVAQNEALRTALKEKSRKVTVSQPSNIPQYKGDRLNVFTGDVVRHFEKLYKSLQKYPDANESKRVAYVIESLEQTTENALALFLLDGDVTVETIFQELKHKAKESAQSQSHSDSMWQLNVLETWQDKQKMSNCDYGAATTKSLAQALALVGDTPHIRREAFELAIVALVAHASSQSSRSDVKDSPTFMLRQELEAAKQDEDLTVLPVKRARTLFDRLITYLNRLSYDPYKKEKDKESKKRPVENDTTAKDKDPKKFRSDTRQDRDRNGDRERKQYPDRKPYDRKPYNDRKNQDPPPNGVKEAGPKEGQKYPYTCKYWNSDPAKDKCGKGSNCSFQHK